MGGGCSLVWSFSLMSALTPPLCEELGRAQRRQRGQEDSWWWWTPSRHRQATYTLPFSTESGKRDILGGNLFPMKRLPLFLIWDLWGELVWVFRGIQTHLMTAFSDGTLCEELPRKREQPRIEGSSLSWGLWNAKQARADWHARWLSSRLHGAQLMPRDIAGPGGTLQPHAPVQLSVQVELG